MKETKNLDELFRDKLLNYEQEPPAYLLENILSAVTGERRKKKLIFWRVAGVAAALLLAFVAGWQLNNGDLPKMKQPMVISQSSTPTKPTETQNQSEKVTPTSELTPSTSTLASHEVNSINSENISISSTRNSKSGATTLVVESNPVDSNNESLLIKPLKSLCRMIKSEPEKFNALQAKRRKENSPELIQKSIDQQIMEQNKQMLTAENLSKDKVHWLIGAQVSPQHNVSRGSQSKAYASNMLSSSSNQVDLGGGISVEYKKRQSMEFAKRCLLFRIGTNIWKYFKLGQ